MRFLSLFSGIEAASEAWAPLGWECAGVAEIDPFACAVLAHRHPTVKNLGDITKITEMQIAALGHIDLIVFGSPCQDLSVAGKQKGLSGERSGLFYPAVDIISWARLWCGTRFALWENVPGAFSSNQGGDFAAVVGTLAGLDDVGVPPKGWGTEGCAVGDEAMVEWATLDAQWFGVAQRRRRIFALADFGNWAGRPPILLEPEGVRGDSAPCREAGQGVAGSLASRTTGGGFPGTDEACSGYVQPVRGSLIPELAACLTTGTGQRYDPETETETILPVTAVSYGIRTANTSSNGWGIQVEQTHTLDTAMGVAVRRLTPTECERLQGFPDNHTQIPWRNKAADQCPDGPRYKALGNSMAVPVMRWIGQEIDVALLFQE